MGKGLSNGWNLIKESLRLFWRQPSFLIPLLFCWGTYAPTILYLKFSFPWKEYSFWQQMSVVFFAILTFSALIGFANLTVVELVRSLESGRRLNIFSAARSTIRRNIFKTLPILIGWAVVWFVTTVIELIIRRFTRVGADEESGELTPQSVAETLAGYEEFSFSAAFFEAVRKGVRMLVFLILPAVVWEGRSTRSAFRRGIDIAKLHKTEFATGFALTELAGLLLFLVPGLLFYVSGKFDIDFPDWVWFVTILYIGFGWSFYLLLEQLFTAELFIWHLKWEHACAVALQQGMPEPEFSEVGMPSVFDGVNDLDGIQLGDVN